MRTNPMLKTTYFVQKYSKCLFPWPQPLQDLLVASISDRIFPLTVIFWQLLAVSAFSTLGSHSRSAFGITGFTTKVYGKKESRNKQPHAVQHAPCSRYLGYGQDQYEALSSFFESHIVFYVSRLTRTKRMGRETICCYAMFKRLRGVKWNGLVEGCSNQKIGLFTTVKQIKVRKSREKCKACRPKISEIRNGQDNIVFLITCWLILRAHHEWHIGQWTTHQLSEEEKVRDGIDMKVPGMWGGKWLGWTHESLLETTVGARPKHWILANVPRPSLARCWPASG